MKVEITFKDPDGVYESISEAVNESLEACAQLSQGELEAVQEVRLGEVQEKLKKWVDCGEYVTVVFDLDAMTASVKENRR